jgi:(1->4)-alpha-D-glucan 1-alpha-D-glucosylmutase
VFEASHELVLRLVAEGKVTGLRVDHIDGLYDPLGYLATIGNRLLESSGGGPAAAPGFTSKILQEDEFRGPVSGTTGYDFLNAANGLFVSAQGARDLDGVYARFLGGKTEFEELVYRGKKHVMETQFAGEMHALGQHLGGIAEQDRNGRDLPRKELRQAVIEVTACFPVYRTYIRGPDLSARDRLTLQRALKEARRWGEGPSATVFDFLSRVLMWRFAYLRGRRRTSWFFGDGSLPARRAKDGRIPRSTGISSRLLNEVGGNPASPVVGEYVSSQPGSSHGGPIPECDTTTRMK